MAALLIQLEVTAGRVVDGVAERLVHGSAAGAVVIHIGKRPGPDDLLLARVAERDHGDVGHTVEDHLHFMISLPGQGTDPEPSRDELPERERAPLDGGWLETVVEGGGRMRAGLDG